MPQHKFSLMSYTGRVKLLPPDDSHDRAVAVLRSHPETRRFLRFFPERESADEARARRERRAEDDRIIDFYVHICQDDGTTKFVGQCGLFNIDLLNDSCSAGIVISPEYYRGGIATEALYTLLMFAFEEKLLHRAAFETGVDDVAMRGWLENKIGAKKGFQWRECWKDGPGKYVDVVGYSVLQREWTSVVKAKLENTWQIDTW